MIRPFQTTRFVCLTSTAFISYVMLRAEDCVGVRGVACPLTLEQNARRRIAKATGGSIVVTLADMEGNEAFDAANLGTADVVEVGLDCGR